MPSSIEPFAGGFLHRPDRPSGDALVLTHGAGGNCKTPLLMAVAEAFREAGIAVLRVDLAFRQKSPTRPPHPSGAAADRAGLKDAANAMRAIFPRRVFLGGQSYGGRQASMLSAEEPDVADALLLLSYPLHPPGKPDRPRTEHFPAIRVPSLFVHGSTDPFGSKAEFDEALKLVTAPVGWIEIEKAGHDLARGKFAVERLPVELRKIVADTIGSTDA